MALIKIWCVECGVYCLYILGHLAEAANANAPASASGQGGYTNGTYVAQQNTEDLKYHGTELVMLYDYKVRNTHYTCHSIKYYKIEITII